MMNSTFVMDINTLVSAFLLSHSTSRRAYNKAVQPGLLAASIETYDEFCEVFLRPKFDKYIITSERLQICHDLKSVFIFHDVFETITDCRDPKDNKFLELAICAKATCLITGDKDLLILHPFRGISIVNAFDFISRFSV